MKVAVFGLGYVGAVTAALLAKHGHDVIGVDINPDKAEAIRRGQPPVVEPGLGQIIAETVASGRLTAVSETLHLRELGGWDVAFVCVGTPSSRSGGIDDRSLRLVLYELGMLVQGRDDYPVIVIRSTVPPEVIRNVIVPTLTEAAEAAPGSTYGLAVVPEFLREGSSVHDFHHPPFTLIGTDDTRAADRVSALFDFVDAPVRRLSMGEAVMVKYASNAFHATKVAFANEVGLLCAQQGLDSHRVMAAFCEDTKLNVSAAYLRPGFAFGGSCLPKDLRQLNYQARQHNLDTPLLESVLPSNRAYLERLTEIVLDCPAQRIGICGMSFKKDTDDLRESPMVMLIETLIGKGRQVEIYDANVRLAQLTGRNREYLARTIPHIASLLKPTLEEVVTQAELVIVGYASAEFERIPQLLGEHQQLIQFAEPLKPELLDASHREANTATPTRQTPASRSPRRESEST